MQDTFQWTDDLAFEFASRYPLLTVANKKAIIEAFKANNSPKKEWEIVAYKCDERIFQLAEDGEVRDADPAFTDGQSYFGLSYAMQAINKCTIQSVRRLSDGEVFSTGDRIKDLRGSIISFEIDSAWGGGLGIRLDSGDADCIQLAQKLPQGIFVTTDGVEMRDKMDYILVTETFDLVHMIATRTDNWKPNFKTFSTREAAEEYILNNRPLLSLNDVQEWVEAAKRSNLSMDFILEKAERTARKKLNQ